MMEGWLEKQGHTFKTWKRRWVTFERSDNCTYSLKYYTDQTKSQLKGEFTIAIDSAVTDLEDGYVNGKQNLFVLQAEGKNKSFLLIIADSDEEKKKWISAIESALETLRAEAEAKWSST